MTTNAELLIELGTLDEVSAWVPTDKDHLHGVTPTWCELVLEVKRDEGDFPLRARMPMRRHDGELVISVLHEALHPNAGGTTREVIMLELDDVVDRIQKRVHRGKEPLKADVGLALGLATAVAIMTNPNAYDVDAIRGEAMERWGQRQVS